LLTERWGQREQPVHRVQPVRPVRRVLLVRLARRARKVRLVRRASLAPLVHRVLLARKVQPARKGHRALPVLLVLLAALDQSPFSSTMKSRHSLTFCGWIPMTSVIRLLVQRVQLVRRVLRV
jgi:hypothetical protein